MGSLPGERSLDLRRAPQRNRSDRPPNWSDRISRRCCKERHCVLHIRVRSCVGPKSASTHFLATPLGNKNQTIMADLSNPSNSASSEELLEEYRREYNKAVEGLLLSCFRIIEHGVVKIKELQTPSTIDVLMEMQSSVDILSGFVKHLIDRKIVQLQFLLFKNRLLKSRLVILAKFCIMLLVKIQFGRPKPKLLSQISLARAQKLSLVLLRSGGNKT